MAWNLFALTQAEKEVLQTRYRFFLRGGTLVNLNHVQSVSGESPSCYEKIPCFFSWWYNINFDFPFLWQRKTKIKLTSGTHCPGPLMCIECQQICWNTLLLPPPLPVLSYLFFTLSIKIQMGDAVLLLWCAQELGHTQTCPRVLIYWFTPFFSCSIYFQSW